MSFWEDPEFGFLSPPDEAPALDVEWVMYQSMGAGKLLRVRSVAWL